MPTREFGRKTEIDAHQYGFALFKGNGALKAEKDHLCRQSHHFRTDCLRHASIPEGFDGPVAHGNCPLPMQNLDTALCHGPVHPEVKSYVGTRQGIYPAR